MQAIGCVAAVTGALVQAVVAPPPPGSVLLLQAVRAKGNAAASRAVI
jgi:hypothetical protein